MDRWATTCPCSCHGRGMDATCDYDGGCGHLHGETAVDSSNPHERRCARQGDCPGYQRLKTTDELGVEHVIRIGGPLQVDRGLCRICRDLIGPIIDDLERDFWGLYAALGAGEGGSGSDAPVSGSRELPIPIRPVVHDLAARIVLELVTWAEPVAEKVGMTWDAGLVHDHTRRHAALELAVRVLRWNADVLVDHPPIEVRVWADNGTYTGFDEQDGVDAAVELCRLHQRSQTILGLTDLRHQLPAPCPRCETMTLYRDNGADHVYCALCRASWAEDDYKRLVLVLADDYRAA